MVINAKFPFTTVFLVQSYVLKVNSPNDLNKGKLRSHFKAYIIKTQEERWKYLQQMDEKLENNDKGMNRKRIERTLEEEEEEKKDEV